MPGIEFSKLRPQLSFSAKKPGVKNLYAELQVTTNFSFLQGASHPEEIVSQAAVLNYDAIGITDLHTFGGIVRAHGAAKECGIQLLIGSRLILDDVFSSSPLTFSLLAYPTNVQSYAKLSRIISLGKSKKLPQGSYGITLPELLEHDAGLILLIVPPYTLSDTAHRYWSATQRDEFIHYCKLLQKSCSKPDYLSLVIHTLPSHKGKYFQNLTKEISKETGIPLVLTNDIYFHTSARKTLHDVLTCIRHKKTLHQVGTQLLQHADRYLKPCSELVRLSKTFEEARLRTLFIAKEAANFSLDDLTYDYPTVVAPPGTLPDDYLAKLVFEGARDRYPQGIPEKIVALLNEELSLIKELNYAKYFLTCHDIVRFARSRNILCQGRGAAANSAVCFCLGITSVDPDKVDLLFGRFISKERNEPPDIDIDFEHERREEVIQYIYKKYGRDYAALTAEVVTYRHRSAVRDVGKVLGLPLETVDILAKSIHRWTRYQLPEEELKTLGVNPDSSAVKHTIRLANELLGFPRHLSQHVGGFIISQAPLCEIVPILPATMEDRTIIEWDKDDIEMLGMLKIDVLALGMLTCIRKAIQLVNESPQYRHKEPLELHTIPPEDSQAFDMACRADTVGVFQIESRAQMSMLPRLKPRTFYDLVIEVAIVRPGPIQGNMIHPYLKRRNGLETMHYPDKRVETILGKTLGVPLFQEQAMRLAIVLANFTPGEAEQLRRAMAAWKRNERVIAKFKTRIIKGMTENGYSVEFAENCMSQIKGFAEYGFPESHAASFALLVYASLWLKCHHPALFTTALLNSLPMGFYAPAQLIADAQAHGVTVLPVDVNKSRWDCHIEYKGDTPQIRLGLRLVSGIRRSDCELLTATRDEYGSFSSIAGLWYICYRYAEEKKLALLHIQTLTKLARADAFRSLDKRTRAALWEIKALPKKPVRLALQWHNSVSTLSEAPLQQEMFRDYSATSFSLRAHPFQFIRSYLDTKRTTTARKLRDSAAHPHGSVTAIGGLAIVRQRPGTAKGVVFLTIEDETGLANLLIYSQVFEKYRSIVITSSAVWVYGVVQRADGVVYVSARSIESLDPFLLQSQTTRVPDGKSYSY